MSSQATDGSTYTSTHDSTVLEGYIKYRTAVNCCPHLLPVLKPTDSVLDMGCGPGSISVDLASRVPLGHLTGVDLSEKALEKARELAVDKKLTNTTFLTADIYSLPFPDDSFDAIHVHQVLQHVTYPWTAASELRRVLKPGGVLAVTESDLGGCIWSPESPGISLWSAVYPKVQRGNGGEPFAGRVLHTWLLKGGFSRDDMEISSGSWCFATPADVKFWGIETWYHRLQLPEFRKGSVERELCTEDDVQTMYEGWKEWAMSEDAWFSIPHGRVLARK
ncbi:putative ubiE/COQ5 methyltransferase [Flagelloscypha sp. PMI_526]|nr:putative ubiE/COQ5 methyltransferase [Flagelloscypha sp. PMI_526]